MFKNRLIDLKYFLVKLRYDFLNINGIPCDNNISKQIEATSCYL